MTASAAAIGYGALLSLGNGASPEVFTAILEVKSFTGVGVTIPQVEVTTLTSPNQTKEWVSGIKDGDTETVVCNLIPGNQAIIKTWIDANARANWRLTPPATSGLATRTFPMTPAQWKEGGYTPGGVMEVTVQLKLAGAIT